MLLKLRSFRSDSGVQNSLQQMFEIIVFCVRGPFSQRCFLLFTVPRVAHVAVEVLLVLCGVSSGRLSCFLGYSGAYVWPGHTSFGRVEPRLLVTPPPLELLLVSALGLGVGQHMVVDRVTDDWAVVPGAGRPWPFCADTSFSALPGSHGGRAVVDPAPDPTRAAAERGEGRQGSLGSFALLDRLQRLLPGQASLDVLVTLQDPVETILPDAFLVLSANFNPFPESN
mmetsp:Transcript_16054/g.22575  ORF Transcript_16054/g.22575 Transcript_16054/m.22575 type:complete len:226 (+) Transcript_16054:89-766(+)